MVEASQNGLMESQVKVQVNKYFTHYLGDKNRFDVSSKGPSSDEGPLLETSNLFLSPR